MNDLPIGIESALQPCCSSERKYVVTSNEVASSGRLAEVELANGLVSSVHASPIHGFKKDRLSEITLLKGLGVQGDAHCGTTVKHRSRVAIDPSQPNLRQVHLLQEELLSALRTRGFLVFPGSLGENITTDNLPLLELPKGTQLCIGKSAVLLITGLRNPCKQIEAFQTGLLSAVLEKRPGGELIRKAGVMAVVVEGGIVRPGDSIKVKLPPLPHLALERV
jgi:MOSC domain-containing protein YiiM